MQDKPLERIVLFLTSSRGLRALGRRVGLDPFAKVPPGRRLVGFVVVASEEVDFQVWGLT